MKPLNNMTIARNRTKKKNMKDIVKETLTLEERVARLEEHNRKLEASVNDLYDLLAIRDMKLEDACRAWVEGDTKPLDRYFELENKREDMLRGKTT